MLHPLLILCTVGFAFGLKCETSVTLKPSNHNWPSRQMQEFQWYVSDRQRDGIDGYCDSASNTNPVCLSMTSRGRIAISGSKPRSPLSREISYAQEMNYKSCDFGLVVKKRNDWVGWICRQLQGDFNQPWYDPIRQRNCYQWDRVRNVEFGTPDVSVPGQTLAGYRMTLEEGSLTIYCCRDGDKCNYSGQFGDIWCDKSKPFPFDHQI